MAISAGAEGAGGMTVVAVLAVSLYMLIYQVVVCIVSRVRYSAGINAVAIVTAVRHGIKQRMVVAECRYERLGIVTGTAV